MATGQELHERARATAKKYDLALESELKARIAVKRAEHALQAACDATQAALTEAADANLALEDFLSAQHKGEK